MKRNMRTLEQGACADREILPARIAPMVVLLAFSPPYVLALAVWANYAVFPQNTRKVVDGSLFVWKK